MSRKLFTLILLISIAAGACSPASTSSPKAIPDAQPQPSEQQRTEGKPFGSACGDGICSGPENAQNCPSDCATEPASKPVTPAKPASEMEITAAFTPIAAQSCNQFLCLQTTLDLLDIQNRPIDENVLKLFSVAVDPLRNRVYVAGIMTPQIAILDGASEQWIGTVETGMSESNGLKYLHVDPAANYLYVIDATRNQLWRIDLNSGDTAGPVSVQAGMGLAAVDMQRTQIYLPSREAPYFTAYDGKSLQVVYTAEELSEGAGKPIYDELTDRLYVLDIGANGSQRTIYELNPENGKILRRITYPANPGQRTRDFVWDAQNQRFFVLGDRSVQVLDLNGAQLLEIPLQVRQTYQSMVYDSAHDRLALLFITPPQSGEVAGTGGNLRVYEGSSGELVNTLEFGRKPHRMSLNPANGRIYVPNGDASVVWSIPTESYATAAPLRLGESVEQVVLANGGQTLYVNSRLGGSYLASFEVENGAFTTFTAGTWPIPLRTDAVGEHLIVLNAWDSTLSVFAAGDETTWLNTISIGLPPGTTDRLPDLAVDSSQGLAYAAYPEFGRIAIVDWKMGQAVGTIQVEGYPSGEQGGGPGNLQVAVDEKNQHLIVLWNFNSPRLQIYDAGNDYRLLEDRDLTALDWKSVRQGAGSDLLFVDAEMERLFVGPFEFTLQDGQPTGRILEQGTRIFAVDPQSNRYWVSGIQQNGQEEFNLLAVIDRQSLAAQEVQILGAAATAKPTYALDVARCLLYVGYLTKAEVQVYSTCE